MADWPKTIRHGTLVALSPGSPIFSTLHEKGGGPGMQIHVREVFVIPQRIMSIIWTHREKLPKHRKSLPRSRKIFAISSANAM